MCTLVAASPSTPRKFRDSKISRIQPYIAADSDVQPAPVSSDSLGENDASQKSLYHASKYFNKNHAYKIGLDGKKKNLSNHELLK